MAKRARSDEPNELGLGDGRTANRQRRDDRPSQRRGSGPSDRPETAIRGLHASNIRAPGISSTANFAQLQLQELLSEVRAHDAADTGPFTVQQLAEILIGLPAREILPSKIKGFVAAVAFDHEKAVPFRAPSSVSIVGSHATGTALQSSNTVDVAIRMPAECFDPKDHVNHRYFAKRALYLAALAKQLSKNPAFTEQQWSCVHHDPRRPCLLIHSPGGSATKRVLRLLPTVDPAALQLRKLAPDANSVRTVVAAAAEPTAKAGAQQNGGMAGEINKEASWAPTPLYNTSILQDALLERHAPAIQAAIEALPRLRDALVLLRVWARQQGFAGQPDAVSAFHLSMLATHLHQKDALAPAMTAPQLMRGVLLALAHPKTFAKGLFMAHDGGSQLPPPPPAAAFRVAFDAVFVDNSGWLNLFADVSVSALQQARQAAEWTVHLLDRLASSEDAFDAAFLAQHPPRLSFDYVYSVALPAAGAADLTTADAPGWRRMDAEVERIARRALGTRATLVRVLRRGVTAQRPVKGAAEAASNEVLLGVRVDPEAATSAVDAGPAAEDAVAATDFRAFWGDKAELRRFPDGSITEAVVWEVPPGERHLILDELIAYALRRHLPLGTSVTTFASALDAALLPAAGNLSDSVLANRQLEAATDKLGKQLRGLPDLTLKIVAVQPLSAACRRTAPFPPPPHPLASATSGTSGPVPRFLEPVQLLAHLEGSGRWPQDEASFRKMKAAMGCQLAEALGSSFGLYASACEQFVDVLADGFAFRIHLWSSRDETAAKASGASTEPLGWCGATLPQRAAHHALIAALSAEAPAFAPSAALAVRWLAAHMFSSMMEPEAAELLVASAFTGACTLPRPGSRTAGFHRFLALLADHPWGLRPLVVDPASAISSADREASVQAFNVAAKGGEAAGMWLVTPYSATGAAPWVRPTLGRAAVARLVACALSSLATLQGSIAGEGGGDAADPEEVGLTVFRTPISAFDALLVLRPEALPQAERSLLPNPSAAAPKAVSCLTQEDRTAAPPKAARAVLSTIPADVVAGRGAKKLRKELLIGFDPLPLYTDLLQERFWHVAMLFYDGCGGRAIGIKWRPEACRSSVLNPAVAYTAQPAEDGSLSANPNGAAAAATPAAKKAKPATGAARSTAGDEQQGPQRVLTDFAAVMAQMQALGVGLVQDVMVSQAFMQSQGMQIGGLP